jgi:hypothetical protein
LNFKFKYQSSRQRWIGGLILIVIIYSLFYLLFAERSYFLDIPRKLRHVIKFASTILVYFVGTKHLGKLEDRWMNYLWHLIHISLLFCITSIGVYSWIFGMPGIQIIKLAKSFQEFLISPVLYVGMGILNRKVHSSTKSDLN